MKVVVASSEFFLASMKDLRKHGERLSRPEFGKEVGIGYRAIFEQELAGNTEMK